MHINKRPISMILCVILLFANLSLCFSTSASAADKTWAGTWSTPPVRLGYYTANRVFSDFLASCSVRTILKTTVAGEKIRLRFSNRYGTSDLNLEAVRVARTGKMSDTEIISGTSLPVTFKGSASVSIPAGKTIYSDEIDMHIEAFEKISVSVYYKSFTLMTTGGLSNALSYVETGNKIDEKTFVANAPLTVSSGSISYYTTPFLCGVDAYGEGNSCIALFGDSTLTNDSPLYLAEKLYLSGEKTTGVLQESIIGNQLLYDCTGASNLSNLYGEAALTRFEEDVLQQSGIKAVFVKIGLNDILHPITKSLSGSIPYASTDDIIDGYKKLIQMATKANVKIYFFARQSWKGYQRNFYGSDEDDLVWTQQTDDMFAVLNNWLKYTASANGFISTDALNDPQDKTRLYKDYTTDGVHLTALGAQVLIDAIPDGFLSNKKLTSIKAYYAAGNKDLLNYTPESKYTKIVPTTKAPTVNSGGSGANNEQATGGATLPGVYTIPPTTAIAITAANGAEITEIFLVEVPNAEIPTPATVVSPETMAYQVKPEEPTKLSSTAKAGIVLFVILTIALITLGVVYGINKKMSAD